MMLTDISSVLLTIFNMSVTACFFALAVIVFRLVFKKAPKFITCLLWGLVALRLVLPFSIQSIFSLVPSSETLPQSIVTDGALSISSGINAIDTPINDFLSDHYAEGVTVATNASVDVLSVLSVIWLVGIVAMLLYAVLSMIRVKKSVRMSVPLDGQKGIYLADNIETAFILGIFRPKIYVPSHINESDIQLVIAHERNHIKRFDHCFKPLGFLLLSVYWFNPIMWICYILFCKDIESACDERVLKAFNEDVKKDYSKALIRLSTAQKLVVACPVAFGETGVKGRVKNILNYKKPAFWVVAVAVAATIIASVCFLTNPVESNTFEMKSNSISDISSTQIEKEIRRIKKLPADTDLYMNASDCDMLVTKDFKLLFPTHIQFYYSKKSKNYYAQLQIMCDGENKYLVTESTPMELSDFNFVKMGDFLDALKCLPNDAINNMAPKYDFYHLNMLDYELSKSGDNTIIYSADGVTQKGGQSLHLQASLTEETPEGNFESRGNLIDLYYKCEYEPKAHTDYKASVASGVIGRKDLDEAVHESLIFEIERQLNYEDCITEGHRFIGVEEEEIGSIVNVYMFYETFGYMLSNDNLEASSHSKGVAVAVFKRDSQGYTLQEMRYPLDDAEKYEDSVKALVPLEFQKQALAGPTKTDTKSLYDQNIHLAKQYLKSLDKKAKVIINLEGE